MAVSISSRYKFRAATIANDSTAITASSEAVLARDNFEVFGRFVLGKIAADVHRSWFPHLITNQDSEALRRIAGPNTNLLSFRGSAKSTWGRGWVAWAIGHNPHIQIGWISYNEATALKSSRLIKRIIESPQYQQVFPHVRPGGRWSDRDWEIDKEFARITGLDSDFTFISLGITGAITSNRFHLTVYDDLIKSSAAIKNPDIREKMIENYGEVIEPCVAAVPGSRQICLGTRFRGDDIHSTEFTPENDWNVIEQGAIVLDANGQEVSAWPDRLPLEKLQSLRSRRPIIFAYQWLNKVPPASDERIIQEEWIQYLDLPDRIQFTELVLGVDLAASEDQQGDFTALVLAARDGARIIVLEAVELRIRGNLAKIREIMRLWKSWQKWSPRLRVCFEKGAYQNSFEGDWLDYKRQYRIQNVICEGVRVPGDKDEKLESISGVFEDRIACLNRAKPMNRLVAQLLRIDTENDDLADGGVIAIGQLQRRARRKLSSA